MRYIVLLALLFTVSACGQKGNKEEAQKKEDSMQVEQSLANAATEEKVGDAEADQLIEDYKKITDEVQTLLEKNKANLDKISVSEEFKAITKRADGYNELANRLDKRLTPDQKRIFGMKVAQIGMAYSQKIQEILAGVKATQSN